MRAANEAIDEILREALIVLDQLRVVTIARIHAIELEQEWRDQAGHDLYINPYWVLFGEGLGEVEE